MDIRIVIARLQKRITRKKDDWGWYLEKLKSKDVSNSQIARYKAAINSLEYQIGPLEDQLYKLKEEWKKEQEREEAEADAAAVKREKETAVAEAKRQERIEEWKKETAEEVRVKTDMLMARTKAKKRLEELERKKSAERERLKALGVRAREKAEATYPKIKVKARAAGEWAKGALASPIEAYPGRVRGRIGEWITRRRQRKIERSRIKEPVKAQIAAEKEKIKRERSYFPAFRRGARGGAKYGAKGLWWGARKTAKHGVWGTTKFAAKDIAKTAKHGYGAGKFAAKDIAKTGKRWFWDLPKYSWRGGMSKRDYKIYKRDYKVQTGRTFTPGQSIFLKFVVLLIIAGFFYFYFGLDYIFLLIMMGSVLAYFIFGPRFAIAFVVIGLIVYATIFTAIGGAVLGKYGVSLGPMFEKFIIAGKLQASEMKSKITGIGEWKNPYAVEKTVKKGIKIKKVSGFKDTFFPDDKIEIIGEGIAYGIKERTTRIEFGCSLLKDGKWFEGEINDKILDLGPNEDKDFFVKCSFKELNFKVTEEAIYPKVKFVALYYNFGTNASLKLYTLDKDKAEVFKDPFDTFNIRDSLLDYDKRTTRNIYDFGPLKISMHVANRQPLTTNQEYLLKLGVDVDKLNWMGDLEEGLIKLYFPKNINVKTEECRSGIKIKDSMTKYCEFEFVEVEDGISFVDIRANAVYGYEFSKEGSITVVKKA